MAHDSRCSDASTAVGSCDCECDGRLHGIGDGNNDHQTAQITEHEQRIDEEFMQRFNTDDQRRLRDDADFEAWEQLEDERPELAEIINKAEKNSDLNFDPGDIYWEKNANGDRMNVIVPGIDNAEDIAEDKREKIIDAASEYMKRKKAKQYEKKESRLRELDKVATEKSEFPEMDHIQTKITEGFRNPLSPHTTEDQQRQLFDAEHRFGDLSVRRRYKESEDGNELLVYSHYNDGNGDNVKQLQNSHDMDDIDDMKKFVKANHNGDPQEEFRSFGD